ncbi:conserved exported protein of unknown function [Rhodovastum atsumiense]|uniref:hypothetical protein n=1 Tax=Rhodovastum atsumiense TaxID=504468 RepID=UPI00139F2C36|nr:hypothetical protein [Rhodovastum atsumiense]CAH2601276.1 conserved exported protein of unknown function [Rhodovastum atsumiense]
MATLGRRTVLLAAPLVAVLLPAAAGAGAFAPMSAPAPALLAGGLVAWVRPDPEGGALIRLAWIKAPGAMPESLGDWRIPPEERAEQGALPPLLCLGRRANHLAWCVVAASWGVDPQSCIHTPGRIVEPSTGRSVDVRIWVDPGR